MRTYVIAEIGSTPEGSLVKMLELVDLVKDMGCDAFKGQWLSSAQRLCDRRHAPDYLEAYRFLEYPTEWLACVAERCQVVGLDFLCSCYLPEDIHVVAPHVARFKIASFEALDRHFLHLHREWEKPKIISTGMMDSMQVRDTMNFLNAGDALLHCVSAYPCPDDQANLRTIQYLSSYHANILRGYSDHTRHPMAGALAVAAGAEVVEFHVRHPHCAPSNADFAVARDVPLAIEYVQHIREAERMLGEVRSVPLAVEEPMRQYQVHAHER